ncbi:MAG: apolipoprotein N-acyltransferase, partial [Caldimonas sp.]
AAVQPGIGLAERDTAEGRAAIWRRLASLTREASAVRPALVVWPETAVGDPRHDPALAARLAALSASLRVPIVVGAAETEKFAATTGDGLSASERDAWNSAYLVADGAVVGEPYRKRVLMPFGEYLPLRGALPWPAFLVPDVVDVRAGDADAGFEIAASPTPIRLAATICWESEFADLARFAVVGGARLLVQLTNDAWFGDSRAAAQHNMASVLRAVENGVPVVLASNAGPSQVIDARGRVLSRVEGFGRHGIAVATVTIGSAGGTWYSRAGDVFSFACVGFAALGLGTASMRRRARERHRPSPTFAKEAI